MGPLVEYTRRAAGAAVSGWLVWAGLSAFELETLPRAIAAGIAAAAGALAPALGVAVGVVAFTAGIAAAGLWVLSVVFGATGGLLWWFTGRSDTHMSGALLAPLLGLAKCAPAGGLLLGYEPRPGRAAALAAYAGGLTMLASAVSGGRPPYLDVGWNLLADPLGTRIPAGGVRLLLSTPAPAAIVVTWALAAAVMSHACSRATRKAALTGAALGMLTLYGGYALAQVISVQLNASATWTGESLLTHIMASSILVVIVVAAGPPVRGEND
jgi:hypothetical protein